VRVCRLHEVQLQHSDFLVIPERHHEDHSLVQQVDSSVIREAVRVTGRILLGAAERVRDGVVPLVISSTKYFVSMDRVRGKIFTSPQEVEVGGCMAFQRLAHALRHLRTFGIRCCR
jgi:hypothetical protein